MLRINLNNLADPKKNQAPVFVKRHTFYEIESNFNRVIAINNYLFGEYDVIGLTRKDVFEEKDLEKFVLKVLYWGFPKNMHGICKDAYNSFDQVKTLADTLRKNPGLNSKSYNEMIDKMVDVKGLGISFFSKLLYFSKVKIDGNPCLIVDSKVVKAIKDSGKCNSSIFNCLQGIDKSVNFQNYPEYLLGMKELSKLLKANSPDQVEYTLWLMG